MPGETGQTNGGQDNPRTERGASMPACWSARAPPHGRAVLPDSCPRGAARLAPYPQPARGAARRAVLPGPGRCARRFPGPPDRLVADPRQLRELGRGGPPAPRHHRADPGEGLRARRPPRPGDRRAAADERNDVQAVLAVVAGPRLRRDRAPRLDPRPARHGPGQPRGPQRAPGPGPLPAPQKTRRTPPRTSPDTNWPPI